MPSAAQVQSMDVGRVAPADAGHRSNDMILVQFSDLGLLDAGAARHGRAA
jgi:hypothetical protein